MASECGALELLVPKQALRTDQSFAIDYGSSLAKVVYVSTDQADNGMAVLRAKSFAPEQCDGLVAFLKDHLRDSAGTAETSPQAAGDTAPHAAGGTAPQAAGGMEPQAVDEMAPQAAGETTPQVDVTGYGCMKIKYQLQQALQCKLRFVSEIDMLFRGLLYLYKSAPVADLLHPPLIHAMEQPKQQARDFLKFFKQMQQMEMTGMTNDYSAAERLLEEIGRSSMDVTRPMAQSAPGVFPALVALCGSCTGLNQVEEDGSYSVLDILSVGGKTLYGKARLMLGVQSFEEFLELAEKGDNCRVDAFIKDTVCSDDSGIYSLAATVQHDFLQFNFGKAADMAPDATLLREDVARALLQEAAFLLVHAIFTSAQLVGIRHVFVCGSVPTSKLMRHLMTAEMTRKNLLGCAYGTLKQEVELHFVKPSAHLGALGILLQTWA